MFEEDFMREVEEGHRRSVNLLSKKATEYSRPDEDRLSQFYKAGIIQSVLPTQALMGMMVKHFTSICDMVEEPLDYDLDKWDEKLTDLRNYTHLLDALVRDMMVTITRQGK